MTFIGAARGLRIPPTRARRLTWHYSESVMVVERELVDFAARVHNPTDYAYDRKDHARDQEDLAERDADHRERYACRGQQWQDRRPRKMDLLAGRRDLGIERAHERYAAATMNVSPNMNMQMPATIRPARMFFLARRRSMRT